MIEYTGKQVTIMSCSNCNANCEHCYISYTGNMSGEDLLKMCRAFKNKYKIIINGTETLLHEDYFEAFKLSDQSRILTNGLVINQDASILKKIWETGIKNIAMSYHFGTEISTVPQRVVENAITKIKEQNLNPELMCTITTENYDKLDEICKKAINLGVGTIRFLNCINTGKCESNSSNLCLNEEQIKYFFNQPIEMRKKYSKDVLRIKRNGLFGKNNDNPNCNFKCLASIDEVVITPDGNVYPCIFMTKTGYETGHYENGKILLDYQLDNNGNSCIAHDIFNKNEYSFSKKLVRK